RLPGREGPDARHRGRKRVGKVDAGADHRADRCADGGRAADRGPTRRHPPQAAGSGAAVEGADGVPEPLRQSQPAPEGRRRADGAPCHQYRRARRRAAGAGRGDAEQGRAPARALQPLSAHVLGRPAPADRHRPGADAQSLAPGAGRTGLGARPVGAGAGAEPARRSSGRVRADLCLRQPRPFSGALYRRRGHGDLEGRGGRAGEPRGGLRQPEPPLHAVALRGDAGDRCRGDPRAGGAAPGGARASAGMTATLPGAGQMDYDQALAGLSKVEAPAITPSELAGRIDTLRAAMRAGGIAWTWLDATSSLAYYTGLALKPSERLHGALVGSDGTLLYVTPNFERPKLETMIRLPGEIAVWEEDADPFALIAGRARGRIALDPAMAFGFAARIMAAPEPQAVPAGAMIAAQRRIKSATEIAIIRTAMEASHRVQKAVH